MDATVSCSRSYFKLGVGRRTESSAVGNFGFLPKRCALVDLGQEVGSQNQNERDIAPAALSLPLVRALLITIRYSSAMDMSYKT